MRTENIAININPEVLRRHPDLLVGLTVAKDIEDYQSVEERSAVEETIVSKVLERFSSSEEVEAHYLNGLYATFYKSMGLRPKKVSTPIKQALRVIKNRKYRSIHRVIDFCMAVEYTSLVSLQVYDLDKIEGKGLQIVQALVKRVMIDGCYALENRWVVDLLTEDKTCFGAVALNQQTNQIEIHHAKAVVLATGAGACIYPIKTISGDKLATGILMSYNAGASLVDMEMVQFHPTGLVLPNTPVLLCLLLDGTKLIFNTFKNVI
jgi:hypothetical protein